MEDMVSRDHDQTIGSALDDFVDELCEYAHVVGGCIPTRSIVDNKLSGVDSRMLDEAGGKFREAASVIGQLARALAPFAATGAALDAKPKDASVWAGQTPAPPLTFGDLRAAYAAIHRDMLNRPSLNGQQHTPSSAKPLERD